MVEGGIGFGVQRDFLLSVFMEEKEEEAPSSTVRYCVGPSDVSKCFRGRETRLKFTIRRFRYDQL